MFPPSLQQHQYAPHPQFTQQQQMSPPPIQQQQPPQGASNMNTPIRAHHHPPAVHQMYSSNGDAYTYNVTSQQQTMSPHQINSQLYSPNAQQAPQNFADGAPLPGGRQPLYANAPPKPRRLNSSSGVEDDTVSPDPRASGEQRDTDNTDDDGGFAEHTAYQRGNRRDNPPMATATYHHPRGANQANIIDDSGNVFSNHIGPPIYKQQGPIMQQNQPQYRHRYAFLRIV